jgi:hypothetical protein
MGDDGADRRVRGGEPLRARHDVRPDVVALGREPVPDAPEAGDHLVGREQDVVAVAEVADALPVAGRGDEGAPGVLDGLHVNQADGLRPHLLDRPLELVEQEGRELLFRLLRRAVVPVRVAHVPDLGDERLERSAQRLDSVERESAEGRAVVGDLARDRLVLLARGRPAHLARDHLARLDALHLLRALAHREVLPCELPRRLDRLGAAGAEEDAVEVARRERRNLRRELDRAGMRVRPVRVEGQLAHLVERGLPDLIAEAVADVDGEEPGERVEIALPVNVLEVAAVAAHDDRWLARPHLREVEPEVVVRQTAELVGGHRALRGAHLVVSSFGIPLPQS